MSKNPQHSPDDEGVFTSEESAVAEAPGRVEGAARKALEAVKSGFDKVTQPVVDAVALAAGTLAQQGRDGRSSYAEASREYADEAEAKEAFTRQVALLRNPNTWSTLSGVENANWQRFDADGNLIAGDTPVKEGEFIRVTLPGVGLLRSDWVRIKRLIASEESLTVVVSPCHDPTAQPVQRHVTAHFFDRRAVNSFTLLRSGHLLVARVHGEHEFVNCGDESGGHTHSLRHRAVAEAGWGVPPSDPVADAAFVSPQQHQWNRFTASLVGNGFTL